MTGNSRGLRGPASEPLAALRAGGFLAPSVFRGKQKQTWGIGVAEWVAVGGPGATPQRLSLLPPNPVFLCPPSRSRTDFPLWILLLPSLLYIASEEKQVKTKEKLKELIEYAASHVPSLYHAVPPTVSPSTTHCTNHYHPLCHIVPPCTTLYHPVYVVNPIPPCTTIVPPIIPPIVSPCISLPPIVPPFLPPPVPRLVPPLVPPVPSDHPWA